MQSKNSFPNNESVKFYAKWRPFADCIPSWLKRDKSLCFLHRILAGDAGQIYFESPRPTFQFIGSSRCTIHYDCETKALWQKDDFLCLMESEEYGLILGVKVTWNDLYRTLPTTIAPQYLCEISQNPTQIHVLQMALGHIYKHQNVIRWKRAPEKC